MCSYVNNLILKHNLYLFVISSFLYVLMNLNAVSVAREEIKTDPATDKNSLMHLSGEDVGYAVAVDDNGYVYVAGTSNSQWGEPVNSHSGGAGDCFVAKLNQRGEILWHTFLGGIRYDGCRGIALDGTGNVYVTGESSPTWAAPVKTYGGGSFDCFVAKLDNTGVLQWNTFLGGALYDGGYSLTVDKNGFVFVAGNSVNTWGSPVNPHTGRNHDSFVAKLDQNGLLQWNTFLGGNDYDGGYAIALDQSGDIYLAGESFSEWGFPVNKFIHGYYGDYDAFVAKLDNKGALQWHTFMGGIGSDYGRGIAVDVKGSIYVTGNSNVSWGQPLFSHSEGYDAFAAKLDEQGVLQWHTFLGGKGPDYSRAITVNWTGNIFLTGQSSASWGKPVNAFGGESDAFAAKLNSDGVLQWNSFLGGAGSDYGRSITMDGIGNIYMTGESSSAWGSPVKDFQGKRNAFATKLNNTGSQRWNTFLGGSVMMK